MAIVSRWFPQVTTSRRPRAAVALGTAALLIVAWAAGAAFIGLVPPARSRAEAPAESSHLPVLRIDVAAGDITADERSPGTLHVAELGAGAAWEDAASAPASVASPIGIELHGASSIILPKPSYDLELRDDGGDDRPLPLLGLPAHSDWVLHGCGRDDTCLRNALAYALAHDLGRYAPRARFVELFLAGDYRGVYLLVERIRRDADRVALPRPSRDARDGDITGGYIFKMDLGEGHPADPVPRDWVSPVSSTLYSYHYPRFDEITDAQKTYLHNHVAEFERVMQGSRWNDSDAGYRAWIDVPSWVDFALLQELSNNIDAYQKSHYFQKWPRSRGGKLALGPIWDFDNAFGSTPVRDGHRTDVWAHRMNRFAPGEKIAYEPPGILPHVPAYWERLWADRAFQTELRCRWDTLRAGPLRLDAISARIEQWRSQQAAAQRRDDARWGIAEAYDQRLARLRTWMSARLSWMDGNLPGACAVTRHARR